MWHLSARISIPAFILVDWAAIPLSFYREWKSTVICHEMTSHEFVSDFPEAHVPPWIVADHTDRWAAQLYPE
ncbi:hypothetical protein [Azoarcus sp. KH32C]|uniref:hypothetical protein n=1 Tax=Azoarcus sp. KH32C TaxID=748247 RepID=UPI0012EA4482|nr:hypothetical protein [Azoarcus sp. KH32C]